MDELEPVDESEFVYRRVHPDFFDPILPIPVKREAFRPSGSDATGLSVFRAGFSNPIDTLPVDPLKAKGYYVVRVSVRDLAVFGLTVRPDPLPDGPAGHCVIPELSWPAYQAQKEKSKPILLELAKLASRDIVHRPS